MTDQTMPLASVTAAHREVARNNAGLPPAPVTTSTTGSDGIELLPEESPFVELVLTEPPEPPAPPLEYGEKADSDWTDWQEEP